MAHRKQFDCGHKGFGQYCHRCKNETTRRQQRRDRIAQIPKEQQGIDLTRLPARVATKANTIIIQLRNGTPYHTLGGKRFRKDRTLISVPVGYRYRLVARQTATGLEPVDVLSHEQYNKL